MKAGSFKPNARLIIILGSIAGLIFISGVMTYIMCSKQLHTANVQLREREKQVKDSKQITKRLEEVEQSYLETQSELSNLETSVATFEYVPTMLKQLEQLGKSLDMKVISVRPQLAPPPPPVQASTESSGDGAASGEKKPAAKAVKKTYDEMNIEVTLEGDYWQARNFIYRLTKFPKIVSVRNIQVSPSDASAYRRKNELQLSLNLTAFVFAKDESKTDSQTTTTPEGASSSASAADRRSTNEG